MMEVLLDMDGTIVDLYGVNNWEQKLRKEDVSPYEDAKPLFDIHEMRAILGMLRENGNIIKVVTWGPLEPCSSQFFEKVKEAKKEWLKKNKVPFDYLIYLPYGVSKRTVSNNLIDSLLIDDNESVRENFEQGIRNFTMEVTNNLLNNLLEEIIEGRL